MYWQEQQEAEIAKPSERVVDIVYRMQCKTIPMDHAYPLSESIIDALQWFGEEPEAGLHIIHGANSSNGWYRPQGPEELLLLTRRTRLELRIPAHRLQDAMALSGQTLDIGGHAMLVGEGVSRPLKPITTLYARYLISDRAHSEEQFLGLVIEGLRELGIKPKKMLPGRANRLGHPDGDLFTRSLMVADLNSEEATRLQEQGLGAGRKMGCGLFIPHKSIKNTVPEK